MFQLHLQQKLKLQIFPVWFFRRGFLPFSTLRIDSNGFYCWNLAWCLKKRPRLFATAKLWCKRCSRYSSSPPWPDLSGKKSQENSWWIQRKVWLKVTECPMLKVQEKGSKFDVNLTLGSHFFQAKKSSGTQGFFDGHGHHVTSDTDNDTCSNTPASSSNPRLQAAISEIS